MSESWSYSRRSVARKFGDQVMKSVAEGHVGGGDLDFKVAEARDKVGDVASRGDVAHEAAEFVDAEGVRPSCCLSCVYQRRASSLKVVTMYCVCWFLGTFFKSI